MLFKQIQIILDKILQVMADTHIGAVLVLKQGSLTGIMTYTDVCSAFATLLREQTGEPDDNNAA